MKRSWKEVPDFVQVQMGKKKIKKWPVSVKQIAMSVYYTSPAAYKTLKKYNVILPGVSTIKKWMQVFDFNAGFSSEVFRNIRMAARQMNEMQKICILSFDEMSIKRNLDYNKSKDLIEGFQDFGYLGRSNKLGDHVLVFYLQSVYAHWKTPVAYFISNGVVKANILSELIQKCLEELYICGLKVKATVCDQGTNNRSALKCLGVKNKQPFFFHNDRKYYALYDVPHLMKSIRNQLIVHNFEIDNSIVSWYDVEALYNADTRSEACRSAPRLTRAHIRPNPWQKMRVKLAVQVFSNSLAAAIKTAITKKVLHKNALNTAIFIEKLDCLFDALNSRTAKLQQKPYCRAISKKNSKIENLLRDSMEWVSSWKTCEGKRPPCFSGLHDTIQGILSLYSDLKEEHVTHLPTRRLNQDPLEHLFGFIRKRCGYERNPTARMVRLNLRAIINHNLKISTEGTNCEEFNECENIQFNVTNEKIKENKNPTTVAHDVTIKSWEIAEVSLERCATKYTVGYILRKLFRKYSCGDCKKYLVCYEESGNMNSDSELIFRKKYRGLAENRLIIPSQLTTEVFTTLFCVLKHNYEAYWSGSSVLKTLETVVVDIIAKKYPSWNLNNKCQVHRNFIVQFAILLFLHKKTLWKSREIRMEADRKKRMKRPGKLTILRHE
ncbi:hypothetical protein PPYR_00593 [Photinus pyralis]|uniref:THAP-type domain-containing protein n=2 Tax=Photinus pyralis TaxID=7054 RepID=A0A5N4B244_PHOPY|nr:hypothetical protein PPYR_00593 [Photinus pyralis]